MSTHITESSQRCKALLAGTCAFVDNNQAFASPVAIVLLIKKLILELTVLLHSLATEKRVTDAQFDEIVTLIAVLLPGLIFALSRRRVDECQKGSQQQVTRAVSHHITYPVLAISIRRKPGNERKVTIVSFVAFRV